MVLLTAKFVESIQAKTGDRGTFADDQVAGLELRIGGRGAKTWSLRVRLQNGDRRRITLGRFPLMSLAEARANALRALTEAMNGDDPAAPKIAERLKAKEAQRTIGVLAKAYFASTECQRRKAQTNAYEAWLWGKHIAPRISDVSAAQLSRGEARAFVREVGAAAGARTGNYAHAVLRQIYNFAVREELVTDNPALFAQIFKLTSRDRVLTPSEITSLWATLDRAQCERGLGLSEPSAIGLQLCLATLQRAGEVIGINATEIDWATNSWIIPAKRSKNGRAHHVPLSTLGRRLVRRALILASAAPETGRADSPPPKAALEYTGPLFPAADRTLASDRHVLSRSMKRACDKLGIEDATPHDLRRTGASMLASERCGVPSEIIARILNHTPLGSPVTQIYNRYDYVAEKRAALQKWADALMEIAREGRAE